MIKHVENSYSYNKSINLLEKWRLDKRQCIEGSIPEDTLKALTKKIDSNYNCLQIGGFVGVAHCYMSDFLKNGLFATIDLNIKHRGIEFPMYYADKLCRYFKFNSMFIQGDGLTQMSNFAILGTKFDCIILDGNHSKECVSDEILKANDILKVNGFLALDDIDYWSGPQDIYNNFPLKNYSPIPLTRRMGLLRKDTE